MTLIVAILACAGFCTRARPILYVNHDLILRLVAVASKWEGEHCQIVRCSYAAFIYEVWKCLEVLE